MADYISTYDKLVKKFGKDIVNKAINYYIVNSKHCIIDQLKNKCDEIRRGYDKGRVRKENDK